MRAMRVAHSSPPPITVRCDRAQKATAAKTVAEFTAGFAEESVVARVAALKADIHAFATGFPMPGFDGSAVTGGV
jgi:hypothetical protein